MKRGKCNTKMHFKIYDNRTNDLRRVFRKFSLKVNEIQRVSFGPYKLSEVPMPGQWKEVEIRREIKHLMGIYYREKLSSAFKIWNEQRMQKNKEKIDILENEEKTEEEKLLNMRIIDMQPNK